jgi:ABC-type lipoprotein release transport system permease subunit
MLAWHLGLRYLRKRRAAWLALAAITLTVAAPVVVTGVTQGFLDVTKLQARASESDVTVSDRYGDGIVDLPDNRRLLGRMEGVTAVAPYVELYAIASGRWREAGPVPCLVDGIEWNADEAVGRLTPGVLHPKPDVNLNLPPIAPDHRGTGFFTPAWRDELALTGLALASQLGGMAAPLPPRLRPVPGAVAGRELIYSSGLNLGEPVDLIGAAQVKQQVEICDTIGTGILEVDRLALYTPLGIGQSLSGYGPTQERPARVDGYRLRAADNTDLDRLAQHVAEATQERAQTWMQRRANMVKSLEFQRNLMAVVMLAIQAIAVFVVYAVFSTLVAEKRHDIGVLLGIGVRPGQVAGAFLIAGIASCVFGGLLGWGIGWLLLLAAQLLSHYCGILLFPQDVLYVPGTPVSWDPRVPLIFIGAMTVIGLFAVALPAWRAARIAPVDILREGG